MKRLCRIETGDPENPAYIDPALVTCVKRVIFSGGIETCIYERGVYDPRCVIRPLTTTEVVALLEAHERKQAEASAGSDYVADAKMLATALNRLTDERVTGREMLVAGLKRMATLHDRLDGLNTYDFADCVLRSAGVIPAKQAAASDREAKLIAGLRRIGDVSDELDDFGLYDFTARLLRDAGVPVEEPEQETDNTRRAQ